VVYIGCSFILKVGVEESIVNAPLVSQQSKNTNNAKSEVRFKQLMRVIDSSTPILRLNLNTRYKVSIKEHILRVLWNSNINMIFAAL
jgi:hypothetical protein